MRKLTWKLVLPLTVISFASFTKWWYMLPVDAPDTMMFGFPLVYASEGWHTSMSLQIFVIELIIDLLFYFAICSLLIFCIHQFIIKIKPPKILTRSLVIISGLIMAITIFTGSFPEHIYKVKRDFDSEVMVTGYKFIWQSMDRPDFATYDPRKRE